MDEASIENKNIFFKTIAVIAIALILIFGYMVVFKSGLRSYLVFKFAPNYAKEAYFLKYENSKNQEIYLLGTANTDMLTSKNYSLLHIQSVIEKLNPNLLLVEIRPKELLKGNLADGPVEMLYASLIAQPLHIKVDGMDWRQKGVRGSDEVREYMMFKNILTKIKKEKKVLVLTSYSHIPEFAKRLELKGFRQDDFSYKQKFLEVFERKLELPPKMTYYLQKQIDMETEELKREKDENAKAIIQDKIEQRIEQLKIITSKKDEESEI